MSNETPDKSPEIVEFEARLKAVSDAAKSLMSHCILHCDGYMLSDAEHIKTTVELAEVHYYG